MTDLIRIDDCGASNPPRAGSARVFSLRTLDGSYRFTMTGPSCILGRNADAGEYLAGKPYVSRQHARIIIAGGEAFIENLSDTNPTFVNDAVISRAVPTPLASGDEVGLGGKSLNGKRQDEAAYFVFEVTE
jgi:pSer/pThr/pTyr-binding forkhead associated (FHA) protein